MFAMALFKEEVLNDSFQNDMKTIGKRTVSHVTSSHVTKTLWEHISPILDRFASINSKQ